MRNELCVFAKIVTGEIQRNRSLKVFKFLAVCVCQTSQPAAVHPQRQVLAFNVRRGDAVHIRHTRNDRALDLDDFNGAIPNGRCGVTEN